MDVQNDVDVDDDRGWRGIARAVLPAGHLLGAMPGVKLVSDALKIGYLETLYLRMKLGAESFRDVPTTETPNRHLVRTLPFDLEKAN